MKAKINNQSFIHFNNFSIESTLDAVASTFTLEAFFDYSNAEHRVIFKPLSYNKIQIFDDEEKLILTGIILVHDFNAKPTTELVSISGYSLPGVIEDCNVPYNLYPLENLKMNLVEIAKRFIRPFGLNLVVDSSVKNEVGLIYSKSVCQPEDSIKDYLSKLSAQRNVILSHNERGDLVMFRPNIKSNSVFLFTDENTSAMTLSVNGQGMHSKLTILRQPKPKKKEVDKEKTIPEKYDDDGNEIHPPKTKVIKQKPKPQFFDTLENPMIKSFRPAVKKMTEGEDVSTETAVRNYMADELKNISFSIDINRWEKIKFGDIIEIQSDRLFLNKKTRLLVESVSRNQSADGKGMSLTAVLPETFTGTEPKDIFI
jgi:prophage tail gpP-like protein